MSHRHRVIFIHVPKTAGTSVESVLGHHGPTGIVRGIQDHRSLRQLQWPHGGIAQFVSVSNGRESARAVKCRLRTQEHPANRLTVTRAQFESYYKFAIIRDPWARAWSWYRNVVTDVVHQQRLGVPSDLSFGRPGPDRTGRTTTARPLMITSRT